MFELPEFVTLAKQMNDVLKGKTIQRGQLGNSPQKFVWYNRSHEEFDRHNHRGGYIRKMDKSAVGRPCPECGGEVEKIQYLGGACYVCPNCQK